MEQDFLSIVNKFITELKDGTFPMEYITEESPQYSSINELDNYLRYKQRIGGRLFQCIMPRERNEDYGRV